MAQKYGYFLNCHQEDLDMNPRSWLLLIRRVTIGSRVAFCSLDCRLGLGKLNHYMFCMHASSGAVLPWTHQGGWNRNTTIFSVKKKKRRTKQKHAYASLKMPFSFFWFDCCLNQRGSKFALCNTAQARKIHKHTPFEAHTLTRSHTHARTHTGSLYALKRRGEKVKEDRRGRTKWMKAPPSLFLLTL